MLSHPGEPPNKTALIQMCYSTSTQDMARLNDAWFGQENMSTGAIAAGNAGSLLDSSASCSYKDASTNRSSLQLQSMTREHSAEAIALSEGIDNGTMLAATLLDKDCLSASASKQQVMPLQPVESCTSNLAVPQTSVSLPCAPRIDVSYGTDCTCLLLHVHHSGIPLVLRKLLESSSIRKVGLNITGDAHKLKTDFGIELGGCVELGSLANQRRLAHVELVTTHTETRQWSLAGEICKR